MAAQRSELRLGYADYVHFPDDGCRHEIVDGDHYVNPAPGTIHQTIAKRLQYQLYTQVELADRGVVFFAPVDVQLGEYDIVQPDLVVVLKDSRADVTVAKINGSPDLLIEILSDSTANYDRRRKRLAYERSGVTEYWIVDPTLRLVEQLVLQDGRYVTRPHGDELRLAILPDVAVSLPEIW